MKTEPSQQIVHQYGNTGYEQPQQRKKKTDLSHQVERHIAVIPDTETEPQVNDQSGDKFQNSDDEGAENDH